MNTKFIAAGLAGLAIGIAAATLFFKIPPNGGEHDHTQMAMPPAAQDREILYWTDPMLPGFRSATPGKSPMNMEMVPVYADAGADAAGTVTVPPGVRQSLGVRTAKVVRRDLAAVLDVPGAIMPAPASVTRVQLRAAGWVERLAPLAVGAVVTKGERLFDFYAPEIYAAKAEFATVMRFRDAGVAGSSENRLRLLGVPEDEIAALRAGKPASRVSAVTAPVDGVIDEIAVSEGAYVESSAAAMTIVDRSQAWARLDAPQTRAEGLRPGLRASVRTFGGGDTVHEGLIEAIEPRANDATRAVQVLVRLDGSGPALSFGAAVAGRIELAPLSGAMVLPPEALIRTGRENRVVLALGEGRFRSVVVGTGLETDDGIEIRSGLSDGDEVVVSGQFLFDSDSALRAAIDRLDAGASPGSAP
ncbi:MAG: efflux RND transporter periplasmic adaptor subunit [Rhodospirillaceae bacterium]|nr:efflux RND transporter periplasmic adaptor subunit [Rhodospirillaceae bacterium]